MSPPSSGSKNKRPKEPASLPTSRRFLSWLILPPWRWRRHVLPKRRLSFNGLYGVIFQKIDLGQYYFPPPSCVSNSFPLKLTNFECIVWECVYRTNYSLIPPLFKAKILNWRHWDSKYPHARLLSDRITQWLHCVSSSSSDVVWTSLALSFHRRN
jgi:hypothetical protein